MALPGSKSVFTPVSAPYHVTPARWNNLLAAINGIEDTLGLGTEGLEATLAARLDEIESALGGGGSSVTIEEWVDTTTAMGNINLVTTDWVKVATLPAFTIENGAKVELNGQISFNANNLNIAMRVTDSNTSPGSSLFTGQLVNLTNNNAIGNMLHGGVVYTAPSPGSKTLRLWLRGINNWGVAGSYFGTPQYISQNTGYPQSHGLITRF